jgi:hypothetical protein
MGCGQQPAGPTPATGARPKEAQTEARPKEAKQAEPRTEVTLAAVKLPQLDQALAAQKGKVVVLDVWANY